MSINSSINVKYLNSSKDKITIQGIMTKVTDSALFLGSEQETTEIPFSSIIHANLIM